MARDCPDNVHWSVHNQAVVEAYNRVIHSVTGMAPDVAHYCSLWDTFEEAIAAGLNPALLDAELLKHREQTMLSIKLKIRGKIHVSYKHPWPMLTVPQAGIQAQATKMINRSKSQAGKKLNKLAEFKEGDIVRLLAPGDPRDKRNDLKPKHADEPGALA
jgi:hypothetical protein